MTLVGCDLHSRKQQVAVLDTNTGEVLEEELAHDGDAVERFYRALPPPVTIGIETTGYTQWFHALMHRLGHTVLVRFRRICGPRNCSGHEVGCRGPQCSDGTRFSPTRVLVLFCALRLERPSTTRGAYHEDHATANRRRCPSIPFSS